MQENERPIIGILAQEVTDIIGKKYPYSKSYIAASYVKAIEGSGARVIPIFIDKNEAYYREIIRSLNGLVLPGGNVWFYKFDDKTPKDNGYLRAAEILYEEVKKINREGQENFPILGICLGLEVMLFIEANKKEYREMGRLNQSIMSLDFCEGCNESILFKNLNETEKNIVDTLKKPLHYFSHQFYITQEVMNEKFNNWKIISTIKPGNTNNLSIAIAESMKFPFIGLQFHPEKIYEWSTKQKRSISQEAISACRYFFDWLVMESKKNKNKFDNSDLENELLISNYHKTFTAGRLNFDELYLFDENNSTQIIVRQTSLIHCII
ncbi:gamma-glutamyl hydrolase [Halyomorpha halys]|uniref:gamma-glutamyl hydrolase n=1 Tax=Halyomorpha halys TaxID=286706 RepID=UPI0006D4E0E8|nr:gamma-glutamyl hydrolase-like [Halyomorpha halys]XP_014291223.1 gamma-glutamyl hydrolase-like [Halyomorpha halys]XP_014291224.1 gamma-glutamyl hydrolase-like [Halyomorpha halys]